MLPILHGVKQLVDAGFYNFGREPCIAPAYFDDSCTTAPPFLECKWLASTLWIWEESKMPASAFIAIKVKHRIKAGTLIVTHKDSLITLPPHPLVQAQYKTLQFGQIAAHSNRTGLLQAGQ